MHSLIHLKPDWQPSKKTIRLPIRSIQICKSLSASMLTKKRLIPVSMRCCWQAHRIFASSTIEAAVKAGKHIFAEKPVAVDAPGIRSVLASVKAQRKKLSVVSGYCCRYNPITIETISRVHDGQIGDIVALQATRYGDGASRYRPRKPGWSDMEYHLRNWYYHTWLSGDFYVEQFVHSLDMIAWAMKDECPVRALGGWTRNANG